MGFDTFRRGTVAGAPKANLTLRGVIAFATLACTVAVGCRLDMHDQPKYESYEKSDFFSNGQASRPLPEGTVARGFEKADELLYTGKVEGQDSELFPFPVTEKLLRRGQERYNIFCSPCHDRVGTGQGVIVRRGMKQPPSFHIVRLRESPPGYFVDVMTKGFGVMFSYASRIPPHDRWAIASYIRALQLSQNASYGDVSEEDVRKVEDASDSGGDEGDSPKE